MAGRRCGRAELPNDIYDQRKGDQQVFSCVHRRYRDEAETRVSAEALVAEYDRHVAPHAR